MRFFLMKMLQYNNSESYSFTFPQSIQSQQQLPAFVIHMFFQLTNSDRTYEPLSPGYTMRHLTVNKRNDRRFTPVRDKNLLIRQVERAISNSRKKQEHTLTMARHLLQHVFYVKYESSQDPVSKRQLVYKDFLPGLPRQLFCDESSI